MVKFAVNLANLAMNFKPNFAVKWDLVVKFMADFALNAVDFGRENVNFAANLANLAMKFKPNFAVNLATNLSQNENSVNLRQTAEKFSVN